jgi:hypothetical protein
MDRTTIAMLATVSAMLCVSSVRGCVAENNARRSFEAGFAAGVEAAAEAYDHGIDSRLKADAFERLQERIRELPIIERPTFTPPVMEEVPAPEGDGPEIPVTVPNGQTYEV